MPGVGSGPVNSTSTPAATKPASRADSNMYPDTRVSLPINTVPPRGASTRAAALARRSAKSTVMGGVPTWPRMPSVPKKRLAMNASRRASRYLPDIVVGSAVVECVGRQRRQPSVLTGGTPERCSALVVGSTTLHELARLGRLVPIGRRTRLATGHDVLD